MIRQPLLHQLTEGHRKTEVDYGDNRREPRSRSNTAHVYGDRYNPIEEEPLPVVENRPAIRSTRTASSHVPTFDSPRKELNGHDASSARPGVNRATTFEGPTQLYRDGSPPQRVSRVPSNNITVRNQRAQLRPLSRISPDNDLFSDPSDESTFNSSPDQSYKERSASPATSHGSAPPSRSTSYSTLTSAPNGKKQAPPPPPSRAKKPPPPPPPPMKRSALSTTNVSYA